MKHDAAAHKIGPLDAHHLQHMKQLPSEGPLCAVPSLAGLSRMTSHAEQEHTRV